jgi:AraC-like DNA-binding protein
MDAHKALAKKFFSGNGSINFYLHETDIPEHVSTYPDIVKLYPQIVELIMYQEENLLQASGAELFAKLVLQSHKQIEVLKSSFVILATLCVRLIVKDDTRQLSFLLEKYANFMNAVKCITIDELRTLFIDLMIDLHDYNRTKSGNKQYIIDRVYAYIQANYHKSIQLEDLAKHVYLSPSYLSTLITGETGRTFIDILNDRRIEYATKMLMNPQIKIADIAFQCGFNDPPYFALTFKKYMGCSPSEYRLKIKNK